MTNDAAPLEVALICFPYYPSKDTGRGHDRYVYELAENLKKSSPGLSVSVIEQGFSKGLSAAFGKLSKLARDMFTSRAKVFHAITPMGGAAAILAGKRNVVVGPYVYSLALGMSVSDISGKAIANLATEELSHPAPVFHGDTLFAETEVLEVRESRSKPDRGTVKVHTRVLNQAGTLVAEFKRLVLVPKREV